MFYFMLIRWSCNKNKLHFSSLVISDINRNVLDLFSHKVSQAVAASGLPSPVWAVVDLYGKCAAVTLTDPNYDQVHILYHMWYSTDFYILNIFEEFINAYHNSCDFRKHEFCPMH